MTSITPIRLKVKVILLDQRATTCDKTCAGGSENPLISSESAKSLNRPGMARLLAMVDAGQVQTVIIAKLDRLTRSVKDLCTLLERFERRGVALVSVAESLDIPRPAGTPSFPPSWPQGGPLARTWLQTARRRALGAQRRVVGTPVVGVWLPVARRPHTAPVSHGVSQSPR